MATLADEPVEGETVRVLRSLAKRVTIERVGKERWIRGALSLARGRSATEGLFHSPRLKRTVRAWSRETRWDAVIVFCSSMMQYTDVPELTGVPVIVDLVDVDSQKFYDYAALARRPKRSLYELEGRRLRRLECSLPKRACAITLVSEPEAQLFRNICPNSKTNAVQNGVDLQYFRPISENSTPWQPCTSQEQSNLVFVGALDYRANIDGVKWFVQCIWPSLRNAHPQLTLGLVGRNPVIEVRQLAEVPGIRVAADVVDVRPYLAAADLVIAPLRVARGIQNKVLEAMAMGKSVVCSPAAAEGLFIGADEGVEVPQSDSEWIACITELLASPTELIKRGKLARLHVEQNYPWNRALGLYFDLIHKSRSNHDVQSLAMV